MIWELVRSRHGSYEPIRSNRDEVGSSVWVDYDPKPLTPEYGSWTDKQAALFFLSRWHHEEAIEKRLEADDHDRFSANALGRAKGLLKYPQDTEENI